MGHLSAYLNPCVCLETLLGLLALLVMAHVVETTATGSAYQEHIALLDSTGLLKSTQSVDFAKMGLTGREAGCYHPEQGLHRDCCCLRCS